MTSSQFRENIRVAFHSIRAQKVRSSLTLLGVVIGVSSVIGVASIIEGLNRGVVGRIQALGSKVFILTRLPPGTFGRPPEGIRLRKHFRFSDARRIKESSPTAEYVSAFATRARFFGDSNGRPLSQRAGDQRDRARRGSQLQRGHSHVRRLRGENHFSLRSRSRPPR